MQDSKRYLSVTLPLVLFQGGVGSRLLSPWCSSSSELLLAFPPLGPSPGSHGLFFQPPPLCLAPPPALQQPPPHSQHLDPAVDGHAAAHDLSWPVLHTHALHGLHHDARAKASPRRPPADDAVEPNGAVDADGDAADS